MSQTKPIPFLVDKKKLRTMYNDLPSGEVIGALKFIVEKTILKTPFSKRTIKCQSLNHLEFAEFVAMYGTPKGYFITKEFEQTLQQLKADNTKETASRIEKCIAEIRKKFTELNTPEEKLKALQQSCFAYNLDATFIKKIIGFKND
ncbi:hypothetical protein FLJU110815_20325 [Flavobacterium jumunjinense]